MAQCTVDMFAAYQYETAIIYCKFQKFGSPQFDTTLWVDLILSNTSQSDPYYIILHTVDDEISAESLRETTPL